MSTYQRIADAIIKQLEAGVAPWRRTWQGGFRWPRSLATMKRYRGLNCFLLSAAQYDIPLWATYRQIGELGGHVRKGEKSTPIIFWTKWDREDKETGETVESACLKTYAVFNVGQTSGIEHLIPPGEVFDEKPHSPIAACEAVVANMPSPPAIEHRYDRAFYKPSADMVGMPPIGRFDSPEAYHAVLFHELAHSSGHPSRLNRPGIADVAPFGSETYGVEELTAELTSAFLCGHCGIETAVLENAASYIDGWLRTIRKDVRMLVTAGSAAQRAADYILNVAS